MISDKLIAEVLSGISPRTVAENSIEQQVEDVYDQFSKILGMKAGTGSGSARYYEWVSVSSSKLKQIRSIVSSWKSVTVSGGNLDEYKKGKVLVQLGRDNVIVGPV